MTIRSREDLSAVSEEYSPLHNFGPDFFARALDVNNWCQSIPFTEIPPLTPPYTASECASSDSLDMEGQPWSQVSLPDDLWKGEPAMDNSSTAQTHSLDWNHHGEFGPAPDLSQYDAAAWLNLPTGAVDEGLSPVLSYESQNSHTLNTFSEPDVALFPPGLDLSFVVDSQWDPSGAVVYDDANPGLRDSLVTLSATYSHVPTEVPANPAFPGFNGPEPIVCVQPDHLPQPQERYVSQAKATDVDQSGAPTRPLLPRSPMPIGATQSSRPPYRALRPQATSSNHAEVKVSSAPQMPLALASHTDNSPATGRHGPWPVASDCRPGNTARVMLPGSTDPAGLKMPSYTYAPSHEDIGKCLQYGQDMTSPVACSSSYVATQLPSPVLSFSGSVKEIQPVVAETGRRESSSFPSLGHMHQQSSVEGDEGRHRSDPLYSRPPHTDGLYHCPFSTTEQSCQHKPTKLKCNYDKFIDSHLKPFRCKNEKCAKEKFSSTACLLRHEREAHGMHGHGERPHHCHYPGCDRGLTGFPRRYNLFDHMRRVHGWSADSDPTSVHGAANRAEGQGRAAGGRKRKQSASSTSEPAAQRLKMDSPMLRVAVPYQAPAPFHHQPFDTSSYGDPSTSTIAHTTSPHQPIYADWINQTEAVDFAHVSNVGNPLSFDPGFIPDGNLPSRRRSSQNARQT